MQAGTMVNIGKGLNAWLDFSKTKEGVKFWESVQKRFAELGAKETEVGGTVVIAAPLDGFAVGEPTTKVKVAHYRSRLGGIKAKASK